MRHIDAGDREDSEGTFKSRIHALVCASTEPIAERLVKAASEIVAEDAFAIPPLRERLHTAYMKLVIMALTYQGKTTPQSPTFKAGISCDGCQNTS